MVRELICINCPMGCPMTVEVGDDGQVISVTGNTCPKGKNYAMSEVTHPTRMITTILPVANGDHQMVSCKTAAPVDKEKIFDVMEALQDVIVNAPIEIGNVLVPDVAGTGVDIIATRPVKVKA